MSATGCFSSPIRPNSRCRRAARLTGRRNGSRPTTAIRSRSKAMRTMLNRVVLAAMSSLRAVSVGVMSLGVVASATAAHAQAGPGDLLYRIERLENQIRQLTGDIEQLQYRNQQLEAALSEMRHQD